MGSLPPSLSVGCSFTVRSVDHSLSIRLIAPTGVVERVYFASLVSIKHLANEPLRNSQVTLDIALHIALLWSAGLWTCHILLTFRSSGSRKGTPTRTCYLLNELFR